MSNKKNSIGLLFNSKAKGNENHLLYYRSMGKTFRVIAIADNVEAANKFCEKNRDCGVIGEPDGKPIIAEYYGEKLERRSEQELLLAFEKGYKMCEQGANPQEAVREFKKILKGG